MEGQSVEVDRQGDLGECAPTELVLPQMKARRWVAAALVVLGAVMLFAAPETLGGLLAMAAGVMIEVVGIALEKRR